MGQTGDEKDSIAPPAAIKQRLLTLVDSLRDLQGLRPVPHCSGIAGKVLVRDRGRLTVALRFEPGAVMRGHGHIGDEQSYVVSGSCRFGDRTLAQGDFFSIAAGTSHGDIVSDAGCLLLVTADSRDFV
jgi:quercetin dioxygenase-like cupin family protein